MNIYNRFDKYYTTDKLPEIVTIEATFYISTL